MSILEAKVLYNTVCIILHETGNIIDIIGCCYRVQVWKKAPSHSQSNCKNTLFKEWSILCFLLFLMWQLASIPGLENVTVEADQSAPMATEQTIAVNQAGPAPAEQESVQHVSSRRARWYTLKGCNLVPRFFTLHSPTTVGGVWACLAGSSYARHSGQNGTSTQHSKSSFQFSVIGYIRKIENNGQDKQKKEFNNSYLSNRFDRSS